MRLRNPLLAALLLSVGACSTDVTAPAPTARPLPTEVNHLFNVGEGSYRLLADYFVGPNHVLDQELGAALLNGQEYQGSVYIRVSIPPVLVPGPTSSLPCITSSILKIETRPGWSAAVRKAGGCGKDIEVQFSNAQRQRATFKYTFTWGLTKVDHGAVK